MKSNVKATRDKNSKAIWEMTFEEFSKKTAAYDYKSSYGGNYQETYIGLKDNENFDYDKQELKDFDKTSLKSKKVNDRSYLAKNLQRASLYVYAAIKKTYLSIQDVKRKAHEEIIRKALLNDEKVPINILTQYPNILLGKLKETAQTRATRLHNLQKQS